VWFLVSYKITPSSFENDRVDLLFDHVNWRPSNEISCCSRSDIKVPNARLNGCLGSHRIFKSSNSSQVDHADKRSYEIH
jgi:hypothetical protein